MKTISDPTMTLLNVSLRSFVQERLELCRETAEGTMRGEPPATINAETVEHLVECLAEDLCVEPDAVRPFAEQVVQDLWPVLI